MKTRFTLLLVLLLSLPFRPLWSNGVCIVDGTQGIYLTLQSSSVDVRVNNQIAVVTTTQVFYNATGLPMPFRYAFPLHPNANAIDLSWYINGQWHKTIISSNPQQDSIPGSGGDEIDQDLLQYLGPTPIMVTPEDEIMPDSTVTFVLKYVELLPYAFGIVDFHYPNRYTGIQPETILEAQLFHFQLSSDRTIDDISMNASNPQIVHMPYAASVTWDQFESPADQDYQVSYQLSSTDLGVLKLSTFLPDSVLHCDEHGNGFVSLIIEPESNANTDIIEKNFSLIIDRSGSMTGDKIIQARNAATFIVEHLNTGDNFNIIDFSHTVKSLFPAMVPYTPANRTLALTYISQITATGLTNISGALTTSIQQFQAIDTTKANIIIFFTDGMATAGITNEDGILAAVQDVVNSTETRIYLFTFGIGLDVDKRLLTRLAQQNNGLATFLENDELEEKISSFFLTINNPVLLNTQYSFEPDIITDIYPSSLPNLYKGQQLILSGRYKVPMPTNLRLTGNAFNLPVTYDFAIPLSDSNDVEKSFLPKIWAKQAIDQHTIQFNLAFSDEEKDSVQALIDSISICYGVISTQFTSFEDGGTVSTVEYDTYILSHNIEMNVSPNPFQTDFTLHISSKTPGPLSGYVVVVDASGKPVLRFDAFIDREITAIPVDFPDALPSGVYYVILFVPDEVILQKAAKL